MNQELESSRRPVFKNKIMKQQLPTSDYKAATSSSASPAARRSKDSPRTESANGISKPRLKSVPTEPNKRPNTITRSTPLTKVKPGGDHVEKPLEREMEESKIMRPGNRGVEQYARLRRHKGPENGTDDEKTELQKRVKDLQSEVSDLKEQLEKLQSLNVELDSQNKHLAENLSAAKAKITDLERRDQVESISKEIQPSEFSNARKLIANKLDHVIIKKEFARGDFSAKMHTLALNSESKSEEIQPKLSVMKPFPLPPVRHALVTGAPPPPPPPPPAPARANTMQKASAIVELYHSLTKRDGMKDALGNGSRGSPVANNAHNSIVGELQNRSAHLLAIKADVETKGDFIKHLIEKVQSAAYTDIEDVLTFVDCLDGELSTLADERAVLKHFNWPERKADALREAAFEYRDLKRLEVEISSFRDDSSLPCEASLKKIESLLDKLERSIRRLIKLRDSSTMISYRECKIPTDWMLDSGMVSKMKPASVKLARVYMKRVSVELELLRHSERESLLFQGVRFAYRAHQFAGGLDPETMHEFEELRERVQAHGSASRELIAGIV